MGSLEETLEGDSFELVVVLAPWLHRRVDEEIAHGAVRPAGAWNEIPVDTGEGAERARASPDVPAGKPLLALRGPGERCLPARILRVETKQVVGHSRVVVDRE